MAIVFLSYIFFKYFCDFLERFVALGLDSIVKQSSSSRKKKKKPQKLKEEQTSVSNGKDEEAILFFYLFHFFLPHFFPSRHADAQFPEIGHWNGEKGCRSEAGGVKTLSRAMLPAKKKANWFTPVTPTRTRAAETEWIIKKKYIIMISAAIITIRIVIVNSNRKKNKQNRFQSVFFLFSGGFGCRRHGNGGFFFFHSFAVDVGQSAHYAFMSSPSPSSSGAVLYYYSYLFFFVASFGCFFLLYFSFFCVCVCRYCGAAMKRGPVRRWPLSSSNIPSTAIRASSATDFDGPR